jgi:hypothetical protein
MPAGKLILKQGGWSTFQGNTISSYSFCTKIEEEEE